MSNAELPPTISVLMGIYNCADLLPGCIDSLFAQTYPQWELIMCDDGSTDNTYAVAQQFVEAHPGRISLLKNDRNKGLAFSLNQCLAVAKGELLARQDADDFSTPDRFEKQVAFLREHPGYGWVSTGVTVFNENGDVGNRFNKEAPTVTDLISCVPFTHASSMFRADVLKAVNGYTVAFYTYRSEDYDLWTRLYAAGYRGYNLHEPLYRVLEDQQAYARKKTRYLLHSVINLFHGYRRMKVPLRYYPCVLRPLIVGMIPIGIRKRIQEARWAHNT